MKKSEWKYFRIRAKILSLIKNKIYFLVFSCLLISKRNYCQSKFEMTISAGANHNMVFNTPFLPYDTIFNFNGAPLKFFPSFGYYIKFTFNNKVKNYESFSYMFGVEYDLFYLHSEISKSTAILYQSIFPDPAYKFYEWRSTMGIPIYAGYSWRSLTFNAGFINYFYSWSTTEDRTLNNNLFVNKTHSQNIEIKTSLSILLKIHIVEYVEAEAGCDFGIYHAQSLDFLRMGINYHLSNSKIR